MNLLQKQAKSESGGQKKKKKETQLNEKSVVIFSSS